MKEWSLDAAACDVTSCALQGVSLTPPPGSSRIGTTGNSKFPRSLFAFWVVRSEVLKL